MSDKKTPCAHGSAMSFLRDTKFHGDKLPIEENLVPATAQMMDAEIPDADTWTRLEWLRNNKKRLPRPENEKVRVTKEMAKPWNAVTRLAAANGDLPPKGVTGVGVRKTRK